MHTTRQRPLARTCKNSFDSLDSASAVPFWPKPASDAMSCKQNAHQRRSERGLGAPGEAYRNSHWFQLRRHLIYDVDGILMGATEHKVQHTWAAYTAGGLLIHLGQDTVQRANISHIMYRLTKIPHQKAALHPFFQAHCILTVLSFAPLLDQVIGAAPVDDAHVQAVHTWNDMLTQQA